jgi:CheY-like chemotaxis protein
MNPQPRRVIIVDDDQHINNLVAEVLRDEGFEVHCCFTSAEALGVAQRIRPDLMVIDLQMETRDAGLGLLRALRANPATADIAVVICSADSLALHQQTQQLAAHGATVVSKPFRLDQLVAAVARLL